MDAKEKVLATMKEAGQPLNAGKIAELSGLDRKEVSEKEPVTQRTIKKDIADLQSKGILSREGGRKDGRWVITNKNDNKEE